MHVVVKRGVSNLLHRHQCDSYRFGKEGQCEIIWSEQAGPYLRRDTSIAKALIPAVADVALALRDSDLAPMPLQSAKRAKDDRSPSRLVVLIQQRVFKRKQQVRSSDKQLFVLDIIADSRLLVR